MIGRHVTPRPLLAQGIMGIAFVLNGYSLPNAPPAGPFFSQRLTV